MKTVLLLIGFILCSIDFAESQQPKRIFNIGFLSSSSRRLSPREDAFRQGLRELGYVEGKNIVVHYRYADGKTERLPELAAELIRLKVDVIVTSGAPPTVHAAQQATRTIPIVMPGVVVDPVTAGFVTSLA